MTSQLHPGCEDSAKQDIPVKVAYKYALKNVRKSLSANQWKKIRKSLNREIGITERTYYNWEKIKIGENYSIPSEKLDRLSALMGVPAELLKNYKINTTDKPLNFYYL
jgi:transcriptional regulator with XRE-family HTH domain